MSFQAWVWTNWHKDRFCAVGLQTCAWAATGWHPGSHIKASPNALAAPVSIACFGSGPVGANTTRLVLLKGNIVADSIGAMKMPGGYSCCINQTSIKIHQAPPFMEHHKHKYNKILSLQQARSVSKAWWQWSFWWSKWDFFTWPCTQRLYLNDKSGGKWEEKASVASGPMRFCFESEPTSRLYASSGSNHSPSAAAHPNMTSPLSSSSFPGPLASLPSLTGSGRLSMASSKPFPSSPLNLQVHNTHLFLMSLSLLVLSMYWVQGERWDWKPVELQQWCPVVLDLVLLSAHNCWRREGGSEKERNFVFTLLSAKFLETRSANYSK